MGKKRNFAWAFSTYPSPSLPSLLPFLPPVTLSSPPGHLSIASHPFPLSSFSSWLALLIFRSVQNIYSHYFLLTHFLDVALYPHLFSACPEHHNLSSLSSTLSSLPSFSISRPSHLFPPILFSPYQLQRLLSTLNTHLFSLNFLTLESLFPSCLPFFPLSPTSAYLRASLTFLLSFLFFAVSLFVPPSLLSYPHSPRSPYSTPPFFPIPSSLPSSLTHYFSIPLSLPSFLFFSPLLPHTFSFPRVPKKIPPNEIPTPSFSFTWKPSKTDILKVIMFPSSTGRRCRGGSGN